MSDNSVTELLEQLKVVRKEIGEGNQARTETFNQLEAEIKKGSQTLTDTQEKLGRVTTDLAAAVEKSQSLENTINEMVKKMNRPQGGDATSEEVEIKAARGLLELKHGMQHPKRDPDFPFAPKDSDIDEARLAVKTLRRVMHMANLDNDMARLSDAERKALSTFNFGSNGFILAPEMASTVLSCLEDITDIPGLMQNMTISGPSVKFLVDNVRLDTAAWACEADCFANNPKANLNDGLGELEIKPETLRYIVCSTRDILEDASINIEQWMLGKVNFAFRNTLSTAIMTGDGNGKPMGILNPRSGIPVCLTGDNTAAGTFTWQDLIMLKWQVAMQYHSGGRYLMNQNTFGLTLTMADANNRPIMIAAPTDNGQFLLNGSPVNIATQMPDVAGGSTPVAFGNWNQAYMVVNRKAVTMQNDPYSAGFCVLFKFEARVGGGIICPRAARLMKIA
jgi:HK97 family phage major capsid protein